MFLEKIDIIVKLLPVRMSFSMYWSMKDCIVSGLPTRCFKNNTGLEKVKRVGDKLILGNFYHELISNIGKKINSEITQTDLLRVEFPKVVKIYSTKYPNLNIAYSPLVQDIYKSLYSDINLRKSGYESFKFEEFINSKDGLLFGIPDLVSFSNDYFVITDFKLTKKIEHLERSKYISQLHFYAYLLFQVYGVYPTKAELIGLFNVKHEIKINKNKAEKISNSARNILSALRDFSNGNKSLSEILNPSISVCTHCKVRYYCAVATIS